MAQSTYFMIPNPDIPFEAIGTQKHFCLCRGEIIFKNTDYATYHTGLMGTSCDLYLTNFRLVACGNMGAWAKIAVSPALAVLGANNAPKISRQVLLNDVDHIEIKRQLLSKKLVPITKSGNESFGFITTKTEEWKEALRGLGLRII